MSLLHDHFERVRACEKAGIPLTMRVYYDVSGTLVDGSINNPLIELAKWNFKHKYLGDNHVFSSDLRDAERLLHETKLDIKKFGAAEVEPKQWTYNQAFNEQFRDFRQMYKDVAKEDLPKCPVRPSHRIAVVIDDCAPYKKGVFDTDLVLTWWNPDDPAFRSFLANKDYLAYRPS